jgi:urease accessory protein
MCIRDSLLAMEAVVLGRAARREAVVSGLLDERCELRLAGRLVWSDRLRLEGDVEALRRARACLNGAGAFATILAVGGDPDGLLERLRERVADGEVRAGASRRCGLVVARLLAPREAALRRVLLRVITTLGADLVGPAVVAQRVWRC